MSLELKILLENGLLPGGITLAAVVLVWLLETRIPSWSTNAIVSLGWWAGLLFGLLGVAKGGESGFQLWSDEPWQRLCIPLLACLVLAGSAACCRQAGWRQVFLATIAVLSAWVVMPRDESWKDMWPEHSHWMVAIVLSVVCNLWATESMHVRQAERWGLWVWVASLASVMALAASSYASMASFIMSGVSCTAAVAFIGAIRRSDWTISPYSSVAILLPCMVAWARFRGSASPLWLTCLVLFTPALISASDYFLGPRLPAWCRVSAAAVLSTISTSTVVAYVLSVAAAEEW